MSGGAGSVLHQMAESKSPTLKPDNSVKPSMDLNDSLLKKVTHLSDFQEMNNSVKPQMSPVEQEPETILGKDGNELNNVRTESSPFLPSVSSSFINIWNPAGAMPSTVANYTDQLSSVNAATLSRPATITGYNQPQSFYTSGYYNFDTSYAPYFNNSYPSSAALSAAATRYPYSVGSNAADTSNGLFNPISSSTGSVTPTEIKTETIRSPLDLHPVWKGY